MYMGIPDKDLPFSKYNFINDANYKPSKGTTYKKIMKIKDRNYLLSDRALLDFISKDIFNDDGHSIEIDTSPKIQNEDFGPGLGTGTLSIGEDEKGKYFSYYDEYNLNPLKGKTSDDAIKKYIPNFIYNRIKDKEDLFNALGTTPISIYDRRYFTDSEIDSLVRRRNEEFGADIPIIYKNKK